MLVAITHVHAGDKVTPIPPMTVVSKITPTATNSPRNTDKSPPTSEPQVPSTDHANVQSNGTSVKLKVLYNSTTKYTCYS